MSNNIFQMNRRGFLAGATVLGVSSFLPARAADKSVTLKIGGEYALTDLPTELITHQKRGGVVRFLLEEKAKDGCLWRAQHLASEGAVTIEHRGGMASVIVSKRADVQSPMFISFSHGAQGASPTHTLRLVVYTVPGEAVDFHYPKGREIDFLRTECANRGIILTDWHVHIRGGLTVEMAAERERRTGFIRHSAMENHGREWEIFDNARLCEFADAARRVKIDGRTMPVGIQVNDRDWFKQIDAATRAKFDYILSDTMIYGTLPNGRANRLWLVDRIDDPEGWMKGYVDHVLRVLSEPISIYANPTYLPTPLNPFHQQLWTESRMKSVISRAIENGIALEIQAESPYPSPRFLKLAKQMGAKFSFGTNNYDLAPKNLSRWLEAITWLDLTGDDIWQPR